MKKMVFFITLLLFLVGLAPVKAGASSADLRIDGPSKITKEQYSILTMSEILNLYSSPLGDVTIIADNFTGNGAVIGTYSIELYASRFSESVTKEIEIEVIKSIGFGVKAVTDGKHLHVNTNFKLSPTNILHIHDKVGLLRLNDTTQVGIITDKYSENYNKPGTYQYEYRIMDATGLDMTVLIYIHVYENNIIENPIAIDPVDKGRDLKKIFDDITAILILGLIAFGAFLIFKKVRK